MQILPNASTSHSVFAPPPRIFVNPTPTLDATSAKLPDWAAPSIPSGYDVLACCIYPDGSEPDLDYFSNTTKAFASESLALADVGIPWPWVDGFEPTAADWETIGFEVFDCG
jgi:hypothetical protein